MIPNQPPPLLNQFQPKESEVVQETVTEEPGRTIRHTLREDGTIEIQVLVRD